MDKGTARVGGSGLDVAFQRLVAAVRELAGGESAPAPDWESDAWAKLPSPKSLEGNAPAGLWSFLAAKVAAAGFALRRGECNGLDGVADGPTRTVWVSEPPSDAHACAVLAHELAHVLLHCGRDTTGREVEVEAEAVSYLVCGAAGLATDANTFPYVALWSGIDAGVVAATAEVVLNTARAILAGFTPRRELVAA